MSAVDSWDPSVASLTTEHRTILNQMASQLDESSITLSDNDKAFMRPATQMKGDIWQTFVQAESDETIVAWTKVLTLIERDFPGFETGSRSPVLALIKVLKSRSAVPADLFAWIKAHTQNRFLPYGSLADRL